MSNATSALEPLAKEALAKLGVGDRVEIRMIFRPFVEGLGPFSLLDGITVATDTLGEHATEAPVS